VTKVASGESSVAATHDEVTASKASPKNTPKHRKIRLF
jgi:hypothetical protein